MYSNFLCLPCPDTCQLHPLLTLSLLPSRLLQHDYPWHIAFLSALINNGVIQTFEYWQRLQIMPNKVYEAHFPWLVDAVKMYPQLLTEKESIPASHKQHALFSLIRQQPIDNCSHDDLSWAFSPYTSTKKEPDAWVIPEGNWTPTLFMESGWTESLPDFHNDRDVWLARDVMLILK